MAEPIELSQNTDEGDPLGAPDEGMGMAQDSPNWRMANRLAGGELDEIVSDRRANGQKWERISRDLLLEYGVEVSAVTLAVWYGDAEAQGAA